MIISQIEPSREKPGPRAEVEYLRNKIHKNRIKSKKYVYLKTSLVGKIRSRGNPPSPSLIVSFAVKYQCNEYSSYLSYYFLTLPTEFSFPSCIVDALTSLSHLGIEVLYRQCYCRRNTSHLWHLQKTIESSKAATLLFSSRIASNLQLRCLVNIFHLHCFFFNDTLGSGTTCHTAYRLGSRRNLSTGTGTRKFKTPHPTPSKRAFQNVF